MANKKKSTADQGSFRPTFPLYLISKDGKPLISTQVEMKVAIGFSTQEQARFVGTQLLERGFPKIGILSVSTQVRFHEVVTQLQRHGVTHLSWDYLGVPTQVRFIDLATLCWLVRAPITQSM